MAAFGDASFVQRSGSPPIAKINPGRFYVTTEDISLVTVLGSCVSACIRDEKIGVGGMNHFMLPLGSEDRAKRWGGATSAVNRFGNYAMENLINSIMKLGGSRSRLEIKLFGGGRILDISQDVGATNVKFVLDYLEDEKLAIANMDVGEDYARKLIYNPATGRARMKKIRDIYHGHLANTERSMMAKPPLEDTPAGSVELF